MKEISIILGLTLIGSVAWADDKDDLTAAAQKTTELKNYSFKGHLKTERPGGGGRPGGAQDQTFEGKVDRDIGAYILTEAQEIVRIGDKTAIRPRGDWRVIDEGAPAGAGRNAGRLMGMMAGIRPPRTPHEDLKDFASKIEKGSKTEKKETVGEAECDVYTFDLSPEGARALFPMGGLAGRAGGGGNANLKFSGKGKAWVSGGSFVKIDTEATLSGSFNGNDFDVTSERSISIFDVGKTKVEIPEDARKAIKAKAE